MMFKQGLTVRGKKLTTRDLVLIVIAIAMVALYFVFNNLNTSAGDEKTELETEVSQARAAYNQALQNGDVEALEQEKSQLQSQIGEIVFPDKDEGGELPLLLLDWAGRSGVQVTATLSINSAPAMLGGFNFLATTVSISIKGSVAQLTTFFDYIQNSDITTIVVGNISADYSTPDWNMDMQVTAYTEAG